MFQKTSAWVGCLLSLGLLPLIGLSQSADDCDCTTVLGECAANVVTDGDSISLTTNVDSCARVDYFVDGRPLVDVVKNRRAERALPGSGANRILVQSCQICRETAGPTAPVATAAAAPAPEPAPRAEAAGEPVMEPLIALSPSYPPRARRSGLEGYVVVEFSVNSEGVVEAPRVVAAQPRRVFEQAALDAVRRWRYPPRADDAPPVTVRRQIDFRLDNLPSAAPTRLATAPRTRRGPANECIREGISYNYGELVEVGLLNACNTVMVVYLCAEGTGAQANRWQCQTPEANNLALVPSLGGPATITRPLKPVTNQFVLRAPNTQYWWIACPLGDDSCRQAASEWAGDVQLAPTTLDPAQASRLEVGRSR